MMPVLDFDHLVVRLGGREILKDLCGSVTSRAIGLLGPNGAGKSTLINTILGFVPPASGSLRVLGIDVRSNPGGIRALVGYMPENDCFIAGMTGVRFVRLMAELSGLPPREALERTHEALYQVGMGEERYRKVGTYSQGMKQKVKLAQAIVHGPRLLLLDEPTNGLDPEARVKMIDFIKSIRDSGGVHILLSSHLLRDVEECCDEVIILKDGRVAARCNLAEERMTNRRLLELEYCGGNGFLASLTEALRCEVAQTAPGRLKVVLREGMEIRQIYQIAVREQVQIRRLNFKRDSLQELFVKAMENANGDL